MSRPHVWRRTESGWWTRFYGSFSRWRTARTDHRCDECGHLILTGQRYVESRGTPWHDFLESFQRQRICVDHPDWAPPPSPSEGPASTEAQPNVSETPA